jgi:long-chain acyl-CoA synthetase
MSETRPWHRFYGRVPVSLEYPEVTLHEALEATARRVPDAIAWDFFGRRSTYRALAQDVERCADGLFALGLGQGDRVLVSMPTSPAGVIAFYAAIRLGALPAMIHPLSTAHEITFYLDQTGARLAVTLDAFYGTLAAARPRRPLERIVLARIPDSLPLFKKIGFWLTKGRKIPKVPKDPRVRWWTDMMARGAPSAPRATTSPDDPAVILFSGGTTALPKGILLSHRNLIAEGKAVGAWAALGEGDTMLAALPLFHGFGLGVCVNATFMAGGKAILVPQFTPEIVARRLSDDRPNVLVGVPTLFDALCRDDALAGVDLSCLSACYSGADTLPREVKERFEKRVAEQGGRVKLLEGYGLTEAVSGIIATPLDVYREGSVGVPLPGMLAKICAPGTMDEVPAGQEGEICVAGPAVMLGYLDDPEATAAALRLHADGRTWLHTGDLGRMDADGFFYFLARRKRMIKSSGFNVYPAQVEAALRQHPAVADACVIGVPDPAQVERVVAYVVPKERGAPGTDLAAALIAHCRERLIKWSCPREVVFVETLPLTNVGKVDYRELQRRHAAAKAPGRMGATA